MPANLVRFGLRSEIIAGLGNPNYHASRISAEIFASVVNSSGVTHRYSMAFNIGNDHGISADSGMRPNFHRTQNLCTSSNIDMAGDLGNPGRVSASERYLMEDQAVHANLRVRVDNDAVRVRDQQSAADLTRKRDFCTGDDTPEAMTKDENLAIKYAEKSASGAPILIASDCEQKLPSWIPELTGLLACPVRNFGANMISVLFYVVASHWNLGRLLELRAGREPRQ